MYIRLSKLAIQLDRSDRTPLCTQLERGIRAAAALGRLQPGDRLPTVRQMASELDINANTVAKVYSLLERQGLLRTRRGIGTFFSGMVSTGSHSAPDNLVLRQFATRVLEDAALLGVSAEQLIEALARISGQPEQS